MRPARDIRSKFVGVLTMRIAATGCRKWHLFLATRVFRDDRKAVFRLSAQENIPIKQCARALGTLGTVVSGFPMRARVNYNPLRGLRPKSVYFFLCAYWGLPSLASLASHLLFLVHIFQRVTTERIWDDRGRIGTEAINLGRKASLMPAYRQQMGRNCDRASLAPSTGGEAPELLPVAPAGKFGCHG